MEFNSLRSRLKGNAGAVLVLVGLFLAWEVISRIRNIFLMPPLSSILSTLIDMLITGQLTEHIVTSLGRSLAGYLLAATLAISLGVVVGWSRRIHRVLEPTIDLLRTIPSAALIPLAILWLGIGEEPKILIISLACFWPIFMNTMYGIRGVDDHLIRSARSLDANRNEIILKVAIPAALPYIFGGLRISLGTSFILLISSEMIAANKGLGFLVLYFEETFRIREMYATVIALTLIAFLFTKILLRIEDHFIGWHRAISIERR